MTLRTKMLLIAAGWLCVCMSNAQNFPITQPNISTCGGFFVDSGGNTGGYQPNENYTTTICPDGSGGSHIQLIFSRAEVAEGDSLCFFDGNSVNAPRLSCVGDFGYQSGFIIQATAANPSGCITVIFRSDASGQGNGWSADINCIQECQTIFAELTATTPAVSPLDTGWIDICPGDRVSFSARGLYPQNGLRYTHSDLNSTFEWTFGDGSTALGPNVSHQYRNAGGYLVQLTVTDERGCTNTNFINQRVRVAPKPTFVIGDNLPDEICSGDTISLSAAVNQIDPTAYAVSGMPNEATFQVGAVRSDSLALPDGTGAAYETSVTFQNFSPGQTVTRAEDVESICVNMEHSWLRDLEIKLICPSGQSITLHNFGGRSGGEVFLGEPVDFDGANPTPGVGYDYCWTNDATRGTWLEYANANLPRTLPAGDYRPYESFANLIGCPLNGEWTISVLDLWAIDNGFIFSWGVNFNPDLFPDLERFTPEIVDFGWQNNPTIYNYSNNNIAASPVNAGSAAYVFEVMDSFGCTFDTTINVAILPPTHPNCRDCNENLLPVRDTAICESESVAFNVAARPVSEQTTVTFESFPQYSFGFSNHPPGNPYNAPITVNSIFPNTVTNIAQQIQSVCIDLETDFLADIAVFLVSPSGQVLELTSGNGGGSDFYANTCFSPTATTPITAGTPPFTGTFRPEGNWNVFNNAPTNGLWRLRVSDALGVDDMGILKSWSITFNSTNTVQYSWAPGTALSCTNCPNPIARPTQTTTYVVTARDSYNCSASDTATVAVIRDAPAPEVTCAINTDSTGLVFNWNSVLGGTAYEVNVIRNGVAEGWQGPVSGLQYEVTNLLNGDTVTLEVRLYTGVQLANCTVETGSTTCVFLICELDVDAIVSTPAACFDDNNGTATITVSGGTGNYTYLWNDPLRQIERTAIFLPAGNYTVTVTDDLRCLAVANIEVAQPDPLAITMNVTDALCVGDANGRINPMVSGGVGGFRYNWSNGQTTETANNLAAGQYTLSVIDANNCEASQSATVRQPDAPVSMSLTQSFQGCNGTRGNQATVVPAGGTGNNYRFQWSNGQTSALAINLDSISYRVTVADENGCEAVQSLLMRDLEPIRPNIIIAAPTCNGDTNGAMGVNIVTGGAGRDENDYTFRWSTGQAGNAINNLAGGITYTVTVTDIQGCTGIASRLLEQPPRVDFDVVITEPRCFGADDGSAQVVNLRGQGNTFAFQWDANAKNQRTQTATNLIAGSYTITVTDARNCQGISTIAVRQPTRIETAFATIDNKCAGEDKGALTVNAKGGTPAYSYLWSNGATIAQLTALTAGAYEVTVTDANACVHTAVATVREPAPLSAELTPTSTTCYNDRDGSIRVTPAGGTGPYQYSLDNRTFSSNSNFIALQAGDYKVYVKDANNCTFLERTEIREPLPFRVDAGERSYTIRLGDSLQLNATSVNGQGFVSYVWSAPYGNSLSCSECPSVIASPQDMVIYELYGIDERGCEATDRVTVVVQKIREIAVPTGFTPNDDGTNDRLLVHGLPGTRVTMFRVYDRWGELLHESGDFMVNEKGVGWDGTFRGEPAQGGVYIWYLEVEYIDGMKETKQGQTTLIR